MFKFSKGYADLFAWPLCLPKHFYGGKKARSISTQREKVLLSLLSSCLLSSLQRPVLVWDACKKDALFFFKGAGLAELPWCYHKEPIHDIAGDVNLEWKLVLI